MFSYSISQLQHCFDEGFCYVMETQILFPCCVCNIQHNKRLTDVLPWFFRYLARRAHWGVPPKWEWCGFWHPIGNICGSGREMQGWGPPCHGYSQNTIRHKNVVLLKKYPMDYSKITSGEFLYNLWAGFGGKTSNFFSNFELWHFKI